VPMAWGGSGGEPGHWFVVFPLLWLATLVVLAFVFRGRRWGRRHDRPAETALGERFARGEITEHEYRERLSVLREGP
jgi:putative membrane protein